MSKLSKEVATVIGITGGIASGKSTAVAIIRKAGYQVIDADALVHKLQKKGGKLYEVLLSAFGESILGANGELDRQKLSQLIFSNPDKRVESANIQNEMIRAALAEKRDQLAKSESLFFMDIPLLFELGYQDWFDAIWLVDIDEETQLNRLMARNQLTLEQVKERTASQMSLSQKRAMADLIIDNRGDLKDLEQEVARALKTLEK
ncbi:dephospho-CoA kinase [Streptococcus ictaluri]|uniref:Dephospho-CoA kinase n=1 Tax=Streptococcus ictaluri 707-05 TaxID=764299 RepID=G5K1U7_9STRE|nr:dephospho-CoA kinase [Streptococcus ictaluri]EHI70165.1 dephospho-CoA kinase [Streptococcus ictaluri 707-05]